MVSNTLFVDAITNAWNQLNAELIIDNLDESSIYDSQWVFNSLDYAEYVDYIREKFATLKISHTVITAETVADSYLGGWMTKIIQYNPATGSENVCFYRIKVANDKIIKGDLCMF